MMRYVCYLIFFLYKGIWNLGIQMKQILKNAHQVWWRMSCNGLTESQTEEHPLNKQISLQALPPYEYTVWYPDAIVNSTLVSWCHVEFNTSILMPCWIQQSVYMYTKRRQDMSLAQLHLLNFDNGAILSCSFPNVNICLLNGTC